jgi:hypothetical protein
MGWSDCCQCSVGCKVPGAAIFTCCVTETKQTKKNKQAGKDLQVVISTSNTCQLGDAIFMSILTPGSRARCRGFAPGCSA